MTIIACKAEDCVHQVDGVCDKPVVEISFFNSDSPICKSYDTESEAYAETDSVSREGKDYG